MVNKLTNLLKRNYSIIRYVDNLKNPLYVYVLGGYFGFYFLNNIGIFSTNFIVNNFCLTKYNLYSFKAHTLFTHSLVNFTLGELIFNGLSIAFLARFFNKEY